MNLQTITIIIILPIIALTLIANILTLRNIKELNKELDNKMKCLGFGMEYVGNNLCSLPKEKWDDIKTSGQVVKLEDLRYLPAKLIK